MKFSVGQGIFKLDKITTTNHRVSTETETPGNGHGKVMEHEKLAKRHGILRLISPPNRKFVFVWSQ